MRINIKQKAKFFEYKYKRMRRIATIIYVITIIGFLCLGFIATYWQIKFNQAIKTGAKDTVTALEMVVACKQLGNFTVEQIRDKTIDIFILNRTGAMK